MAKNVTDRNNVVYIVSTMTGDVSYTFWETIGGVPRAKDKITIRGGANLPSAKSGFGDMGSNGEGSPIWTPAGVVTPLRLDRYEKIKDHWLFKKHVEHGRISVSNTDIRENHRAVKKIVSGMESHDSLAQLTPANYKTKVAITTDKGRASRDLQDIISRA